MAKNSLTRVSNALSRHGFLMLTDAAFPNVATLIAGQPIKGSWWGHAKGNEIFNTTNEFCDRAEVLCTKFLSGKVCFVHLDWWTDLINVARDKGSWQTATLSTAAKQLLRLVEDEQTLRSDALPKSFIEKYGKPQGAIKELEKKLLVQYDQVHTETGNHAKVISTWNHWCESRGFYLASVCSEEAMARIEGQVTRLNNEFGAAAKVPWPNSNPK